MAPDWNGGSGGRRGGVANMQAARCFFQQEIVDHRTVALYCLRANSGGVGFQVGLLDPGALLFHPGEVRGLP